jgi:flavin reductase (NADH)/flavin reductase
MQVDPQTFRQGMRRLAASVGVITTRGKDGMPIGMTATAISSLSADPPMLLCCINRSNATREKVAEAGLFTINILAEKAAELAARFASPVSMSERFAGCDWRNGENGAPIFRDACAAFECEVAEIVEAGSHSIFLARVKSVTLPEESETALLYANGSYGQFTSLSPA